MISYLQTGTPEIGIDKEEDATCYVGELDSRVTEEILWELFLQVGVVINVHIPKDKITNIHGGFGFIEFRTEEDADYAIKIMNNVKLYGRPIKVNRAFKEKKTLDVGANLFVGNISPEVSEKDLLETFNRFGIVIATPKIVIGDSGESRGFAFISFDSFEASDNAIEAMNGQYLCGRPISVSYAIKKDTKSGEKYGTAAERLLAAKKIALRNKAVESAFGNAPPQNFISRNLQMNQPNQQQMNQMPPPGLDGRFRNQPFQQQGMNYPNY